MSIYRYDPASEKSENDWDRIEACVYGTCRKGTGGIVEVVEGLGYAERYSESSWKQTHISGSFVMSATAAIGIQKLLAGPQKSALQNIAIN